MLVSFQVGLVTCSRFLFTTMENGTSTYLNSPVIRKNTPIRRLGLSRKRKSSCSQSVLSPKIQACVEKSTDTPTQSDKSPLAESVLTCSNDCEDGDTSAINYDDEIELLKRKILEAEEKLQTLQSKNNNIKQLEDLIEIWKDGCKKAFLQFSQFIQERQSENNLKAVLNKLGILEIMTENFESDPEISLSD